MQGWTFTPCPVGVVVDVVDQHGLLAGLLQEFDAPRERVFFSSDWGQERFAPPPGFRRVRARGAT
jgi:hypothetical protein